MGKVFDFASHRALSAATRRKRPAIAARIGVSNARLARQCQTTPTDEQPEAWGVKNLLDRIGALIDATEAENKGGSDHLMAWIWARYFRARFTNSDTSPSGGSNVLAFPSVKREDECATENVRFRRVA